MKNPGGLFRQSVFGAMWMSGGRVTNQITHLAVRFFLARLLVPEDFGLIAMAMLVANFSYLFLDLGFGDVLIHRQELTEEHCSTAFWVNVLAGCVVFAGLVATAPFVARFFEAENLTQIMICLSANVVLVAPRITIQSLQLRETKFQTVALRQVLDTAVGGITGIILALAGFGVWALVGEYLVGSLVGTLLLYYKSPWRPRFVFHYPALVEMWQYSSPLAGAQLFTFLSRNTDTLLIGRFLDAASLGFYNIGYQFVLMPLMYITRPLNNVLFVALSKVQDDHSRIQRGYLQTIRLITLVTFPLMTLMALDAGTLIPVVLGKQWLPAAGLIPYMCIVGLVQSIQYLMPSVFKATGNTKKIFLWTLVSVIANVLGFSVGILGGIRFVAISYACVTLLAAPYLQHLLLSVLGISWRSFAQELFLPFSMALGMILVWYVTRWLLESSALTFSPIISVTIQSFVALVAYVSFAWYGNPSLKETLSKLGFLSQTRGKGDSILVSK